MSERSERVQGRGLRGVMERLRSDRMSRKDGAENRERSE
jgi:hypothetical protein